VTTSLREMLNEAMFLVEKSQTKSVCFLSKRKLDKRFINGFGPSADEIPVLYAWTDDYVYFTINYDGVLSVESVPRNPTKSVPKGHIQ